MAHLTLAGLSDDGTRLLLVDDAGREFTLAVDAKLRAALRGDHSRLGQLEIPMDSTLRPRDIQARIRAGSSPEDVADAAGTSVDKIMAFAGPVLAEREHIASRAQTSSVRRRNGADSGARTLGDAVRAQFISSNIPPDSVEWDSFRREDGTWSLTGVFDTPDRSGTGTFTYNPPGNFVVPEDDHARWLIGDLPREPAARADAAADDEAADADATRPIRRRRLSAVRSDDDQELPLGDDAIELVSEDAEEPAVDRAPVADERVQTESAQPDPVAEADTIDLSETAARIRAAGEEPASDAESQPELEVEEEPAPAPPARRPVKKTRGRASVPSWDEIMFGGGKPE